MRLPARSDSCLRTADPLGYISRPETQRRGPPARARIVRPIHRPTRYQRGRRQRRQETAMDLRQREHIETVVQATTYLAPPAVLADRIAHDAIIQNSWRRCVHQYGLDPSRMQAARILPQPRLREHQERIDDFARIARHGLQSLYGQV